MRNEDLVQEDRLAITMSESKGNSQTIKEILTGDDKAALRDHIKDLINQDKKCLESKKLYGCKLQVVDKRGRNLGHLAADMGDVTSLELLIKNNAGYLLNRTDFHGQSPLHSAANNNQIQAIKFLVDYGIDLNVENYNRRTPLHTAAELGQVESLKVLLELGVEANTKIRYYDMTAMHLAARAGNVDIIRELSKYNNTVNTRDADDRTPLWHAVAANQLDSVKELIKLGAEISSMVIWEAVDRGYLPLVQYLVSKGADVNAKAGYDSSLLVRAAFRDYYDTTKFLIDKGADVQATCCYIRWTALHEAAYNDNTRIAKLLMDRGADIFAVDRRGQTPLDVTGPKVFQMFCERRAIISSTN